jgi:hypothetical protein
LQRVIDRASTVLLNGCRASCSFHLRVAFLITLAQTSDDTQRHATKSDQLKVPSDVRLHFLGESFTAQRKISEWMDTVRPKPVRGIQCLIEPRQ